MGTLVTRTVALVVNVTATVLLAFFAFGPSPYGAGWRVFWGLAALGASVGAVASFAKLRRTIRSSS
jgi:cell division protein FtsX